MPAEQQQQQQAADPDAGPQECSEDIMEGDVPPGSAVPANAALQYGSGMAVNTIVDLASPPAITPMPWHAPAATAAAVPRGLPALKRVREGGQEDTEKLLMAKDMEILKLRLQVHNECSL